MKTSRLSILTAIFIGLFGSQLSLPAEANGRRFYCDNSQKIPIIKIKTSRGDEEFIQVATGTKRYSRIRRCQELAERFERQRSRGRLHLTSHENVNGYPVICYTDRVSGQCNPGNVLVTLKKGSNHKAESKRFSDFGSRRSSNLSPIKLSGDGASANEPITMSGGNNSDLPPIKMDGSASGYDENSYVKSTPDGDYFDLGRMVNDLSK